jgi:DNA repair protein RadC
MLSGRKGVSKHELLELLLFYAIPRRDVKNLAKTLLDRFGSLERILSADVEQLMLTDGIGENSALLIKLFNALKAETDAAGKHDQLILSDYFVVRDYLKKRKVILANNHPDKTPVASKSDINYTIHARRLLSEFGVALIDHYIICGEKVVSLLKNSEA